MIVKLDTRKLDALIKELPKRTDDALGKVADTAVQIIQDDMSATSPSPAGGPPGIVSDELKDSQEARHDGQNSWSIWGDGIWEFLEYGTTRMPARPFIDPAIRLVEEQLPEIVAEIFKV